MLARFFALAVATLAAASGANAQMAPTADAGADAEIECASAAGTQVVLDGTGSSDPDVGDTLTFLWTGDALPEEGVAGAMPTVVLPVGVHLLTLTVTDSTALSDTDEVGVAIEDTTPPELVVGGAPVSLWPPNHMYRRIGVDDFVVSVADGCDGELDRDDVRFDEVTSDEPEDGRGDGSTEDDIVLANECRAVDVRSERQGPGDGRVYEAVLVLEDASGNADRERIDLALVAHDQGKQGDPVDSGDAFGVDGPCESPLDLCPPEPEPACTAAEDGFSKLRMTDHPRGHHRDRLAWLLSGFDSDVEEFGDPTVDTDYQLCVWVEDGEDVDLVIDSAARAGERWRATRSGFKYRLSRHEHGDGIDRIQLHAGDSGRGRVVVSGSGSRLDIPNLPLPEGAEVHTQLHNSDGECWGASFDDPRTNSDTTYSAKDR